ncbi:MAG: heparinase II/III domain-containing protein [Planctomycetota bacterium]
MQYAWTRKNAWEHAPGWLKRGLTPLLGRVPPAWLLGRRFRRHLRFVRDAHWWPRASTRMYQTVQLRRIRALATERSVFYRELFRQAGFQPEALRCPEDLAAAPLIDKETVRANLPAMCTTPPTRPWVDRIATAGTGGSPLAFYISADRSAVECAYLMASWERIGWTLGTPLVVLRGEVVPPVRRGTMRYSYDPMLRQVYPDGGSVEQAVGYHLFVLQLLLAAGIAARRTGADFPDTWWAVLERMGELLGTLCEGGPVPMLGDCDDGYVLDLGDGPRRAEPWLTVLAALLGRADGFGVDAAGWLEPAAWLLGATGAARTASRLAPADGRLAQRAFDRTGLYLFQCGRRGGDDRISVTFDCGDHGLAPLAAHAHADALGVTLRAFGRDVLVGPGTYDYFTWRPWRAYFRSTRAHNTLEIDGREQSVSGGPFLWTRHANAWCTTWSPEAGRVVGMHDGYTRLRDPVAHRRSVTLNAGRRTVIIRDEILAKGCHDAALRFHVAEDTEVVDAGDNCCDIRLRGSGEVTLNFDAALTVKVVRAAEDPIIGWVSRGYHRKAQAATIVASCRTRGTTSLITRIHAGSPEAS